MGVWDMYADKVANWISGGTIFAKRDLSAVGLRINYDKIMTKPYISKVWVIEGVPVHFEYYLSDLIRGHMAEMCPKVKTIINISCEPSTLKASDDTFKRQLARASASYDRYEKVFESLRPDEQMTGKVFRLGGGATMSINKKQFDKARDCRDSYQYVYQKILTGAGLFQTSYFVQCYAKNNHDLQQYKKQLTSLLESRDILFSEVKGSITQYLDNYGAAGYNQKTMKHRKMLCSDENLISFTPTSTHGLSRDSGVLMGIDVNNKLPAMVNFFESGSGQTLVYLGKTGSGKTFAAFLAVLNILASNHHTSVIDIKGGEWRRLLEFSEGQEISMDGDEPYFVNTLRLDDMELNEKTCGFYYRNAIEGTVRLFSLMVALNPNEGSQRDLELLLEAAVVKVLNKANVVENIPSTFKNTQSLRYEAILEILEELKSSASYTESQRELVKLIKTRCGMFFSSEGRYCKAFQRELTLAGIIDSPLVIYSFNKNSGTMLDAMDSIRIFMAQFLEGKKHFFRKQKGLQNICVYEEIQRCINSPDLIQYISGKITGGRSDNVTNIMLLNSLQAINAPSMHDIRSNISTWIIGKVADYDIKELVENYGFDKEKKNLEDLLTEKFEHCFYMKYDTGKHKDAVTIKAYAPDEMWSILNTRDRDESMSL